MVHYNSLIVTEHSIDVKPTKKDKKNKSKV